MDKKTIVATIIDGGRSCVGVNGHGIQSKHTDGAGPAVTHVSALARTHAEIQGRGEREGATDRVTEIVVRL